MLDTAETRNQLTITTEQLDSLPLPGHDQLGLVTLAPGVTGLGRYRQRRQWAVER